MRKQKLIEYKEVADILNEQGVMPYSARQWSQAMVQSVIYGKIKNQDAIKLVENTLELIRKENN